MPYFHEVMEHPNQKGWLWAHCAMALFTALLLLAMVLPNAGRVVVDHTTPPPTPHIVGRLHDSLVLICIAGVPLLLIIMGVFFRRSWLVIPGWILMAALMALVLTR
jgi:hypothetical protein